MYNARLPLRLAGIFAGGDSAQEFFFPSKTVRAFIVNALREGYQQGYQISEMTGLNWGGAKSGQPHKGNATGYHKVTKRLPKSYHHKKKGYGSTVTH